MNFSIKFNIQQDGDDTALKEKVYSFCLWFTASVAQVLVFFFTMLNKVKKSTQIVATFILEF